MTSIDEYNESVEDQASFWLVRLSASDCSPEDRFAFEAWKQDNPEHEAMYLRLQRENALLDRHMTDPQILEMLEEARIDSQPTLWSQVRTKKFGMISGGFAAVAASFVLAFMVLTGTLSSTEQPGTQIAEMAPVLEFYETAIGERSNITLSDSSVLAINTNTRIEVEFTASQRLVRLIKGQAFFEVEKDVERPFVVEAGGKRVVALGTAFDVRFDAENVVEVTLVEGRVQVDDIVDDTGDVLISPVLPAPSQSIELNPGERLVARLDADAEIVATDTIEETSWRKGQLVFRQRALKSVIEEMDRYSTQNLILSDDERVQELMVSGVFNSGGRASSFVNALEAMHPLRAERTGPNELTLVWRE